MKTIAELRKNLKAIGIKLQVIHYAEFTAFAYKKDGKKYPSIFFHKMKF